MSCNCDWRDKRNTKKGGKYEMDALLVIQNYVHALARRMDQLSTGNTLKACDVCGIQGHSPSECTAARAVQKKPDPKIRPEIENYPTRKM